MPDPDQPEIFELLDKIRYDATAIQAKVTDAKNMLAAMNLPAARAKVPCPECGIKLAGERSLATHLANVHGHEPAVAEEARA